MKRIVAQKDRIFRKKFRRIFIPGSREILNELKAAGYRLALVTGTPRHEVNRILPKSLLRLFSCIVAGGEVPRGKPSPEPYLKAAQLLGVRPAVCLVVENAPLGIESAKKAGMNCVAVTTSLPPEYLKMADAVINDLCVIRLILKKGRL